MTQPEHHHTYGDDAIARLTGLTLDPETPPHMQQQYHALNGAEASNGEAGDEGEHAPVEGAVQEEGAEGDASNTDAAGQDAASGNNVNGASVITLRSLVTTKEAGVVIGKGGKNVAEVREATGVKAGVSKVIQGVHERILTITGPLNDVSKAYSIIARHLLENPTSAHGQQHTESTTIRLLVSHQLMGSVIGKGGSKIREIQEASGAKIVVSKEMLPQSTERVIDVFGNVDSIQIAVYQVGECILNDLDRAAGTILYNPQVRLGGGIAGVTSRTPREDGGMPERTGNSGRRRPSSGDGMNGPGGKRFPARNGPSERGPNPNAASGDLQTQTLSIPADMVGCIIGKGGAFINHIRRLSGSRISISKLTDPATNERTFTITGTSEANSKALGLLYNQLENEKQRRMANSAAANEEGTNGSGADM
ncbi:RNA binding protein, heterogenous nuclear RNP-K like protein [Quaeritorhiza haematococci]|nr:RNA binding protein, heterogenous nuclear RNP-K like protein [Quaeritorhiza haematococci]